MKSVFRSFAAFTLCVAGATQVFAQSWPSRAIRLIVPNAAGSATDTMARLLANEVGRALGPGMVVENVAGPQGLTGHQAAARAEPDGYTFLFTNTSGLAGNPVSFKSLPYDPARDFVAVAMVCNLGPQLVSANAETPYRSMADILAAAKAKPGELSYAVDATVGAGIIAARMLAKRTGVEMPQVPYRSPAQMGPDVAQGRVPVMISSIAVANPFLESKQIRPIAVTSAKRFPGMPDTPTLAETVPEVVIDGWFVVVAPRGVPEPIIRRVNAAIGEFLKGEDIRKRLIAIGLATEGAGTPESTAEYIAMQQARWREIAREINLEAQ